MPDSAPTLKAKVLRWRLFNPKVWSGTYVGVISLCLELAAVVVWAVFFTRPYLDMDPSVAPTGREFLSAIQMHTVWERVRACGLCALWYGNVRGGFPAFADPVASTLHPLVIATTWLWGVVNGSKVALVGIFAIAGLGQWWLASVLGLRWHSRVWGGAMAVVGGYLAARMDLGAFSLVLSTAFAVLTFPAIAALARSRSRISVVFLAVILAMVAVGGTGYMQVGLALILPTAVFLVPWRREEISLFVRRIGLAVGLAVLLSAPMIVPFAHFMPQFAKDYDVTFKTAQSFAYVPLNLVIRDLDFYLTDALGKLPLPAHYVNFVGWVPVLLALWGLRGARNVEERRAVAFLGSAAILALWIASGTPLVWMVKIIKLEWLVQLIAGIRYTSLVAGLAVPPVLGLAAIGLDQLLAGLKRRISLSLEGTAPAAARLSLDLRWLLVIPLGLALSQAKSFSSRWIKVATIRPEVAQVIEALRTPDLAWVNVPRGEHFLVTPAVEQGLKLSTDFFRTWQWKGRPEPPPLLEANRNGPPPGMTEQSVVDGVHIHRVSEERPYAVVVHPDGSKTACTAHGTGGNIDVTCKAAQAGYLVVEENSWSGWKALIDGQRGELRKEVWLSVAAPEGEHTYTFRYRPWDFPLGIVLFAVGVVISGWLLWRDRDEFRGRTAERESQPDAPVLR